MKTNVFSFACVLVMAALCGCQSGRVVAPPPGAVVDPASGQPYPNVTVEPGLQPYVAVNYDRVIVDRPTGGSPLAVQVPLRSQADRQMLLQYQFRWFDDAGRLVGETAWKFTPIEPLMETHLRANATTAAATDWRVEVRSAR